MVSNPNAVAFIVASTNHGTLIVNRLDYHNHGNGMFGVGDSLLRYGTYEGEVQQTIYTMLALRRKHHGDGVVVLDCGANIGVHTVVWARSMTGWGRVEAFEAQERLYYALCGNIAINNCWNARAHQKVLGDDPTGTMNLPLLDYTIPSSYGSLELRQTEKSEPIGQEPVIDSAETGITTIDDMVYERVDFIKIDVEGMELEVLYGARDTIKTAKPMLLIEAIKDPDGEIVAFLRLHGYRWYPLGLNYLAVHRDDPVAAHVMSTAEE
jgi:FkbM family methyltransferase